MTDSIALRQKIQDSGLKMKYIAEQLNLSPWGFSLKVSGKSGFYAEQINKLCDILNIKPKEMQRIFFANVIDFKSTREGKT